MVISMRKLADVTLFHASKGGIKGNIQPINQIEKKNLWDFGTGFYMGTNKNQGKSLIANINTDRWIYTLNCKLSMVSPDKVLALQGLDWGLFVLFNRGKFKDITYFDVDTHKDITIPIANTKLWQRYSSLADGKDFIVGPIADDVLFDITDLFSQNLLTDFAFLSCIKAMDYGYQYVARTQEACNLIEVIKKERMNDKEIARFKKIAYNNSIKGSQLKNKILANPSYRKGYYFSDLISMYNDNMDLSNLYSFPKTHLSYVQ